MSHHLSAQDLWVDETPKNLLSVTYGKGVYVTVGEGGYIATAGSDLEWAPQVSPTTNELKEVIFGGELFLAVGNGGTIVTSSDGTNWVLRRQGSDEYLLDITFGNGIYLAVGGILRPQGWSEGLLLSSLDGVGWRKVGVWPRTVLSTAAAGRDSFVVLGLQEDPPDHRRKYISLTSADGDQWDTHFIAYRQQPAYGTAGNGFEDVTYHQGRFVAVGVRAVATSLDGTNWTVGVGPVCDGGQQEDDHGAEK